MNSTSTNTLRQELTAKKRLGWEANGFEDGLAGRDDRVPYGRMSVRDTYMTGWRDGDQVRRMTIADAAKTCSLRQYHGGCYFPDCPADCAGRHAQKEPRSVAIIRTGHPAPPAAEGRYLGTASLSGGNLMFHVFELVPLVTSQ